MPLSARRTAAYAAFAVLLASAVPPLPHLPDRDPFAARHAALTCFATSLLSRTPPGSTVEVYLPPDEADGGLINHRLRYLLPGRFVRTNVDSGTATERHGADFVATWTPGVCTGSFVAVRGVARGGGASPRFEGRGAGGEGAR
jgi:hypothetical protein